MKSEWGERPERLETGAGQRKAGDGLELDAETEQAVRNFRLSVRAWSEAAYSRPRTVELTVRRRSWRLAAGWALGCALVAGSVTGSVIERRHQQEVARIAAQKAEEQRLEAQQREKSEDQSLMATVDSDVSQEVPSAMEPLAQLMENSGTE